MSSTFYIALKLPFGKTTVMHLVARETLPEPNSQGKLCPGEVSHLSHKAAFKAGWFFLDILKERVFMICELSLSSK
jgi:hypothetical protein